MLIEKLNENLVEYEKLLKKRESELLHKKRLDFVGISLNNVLPDEDSNSNLPATKKHHHGGRGSKKRNRVIRSDDEDYEDEDELYDDDLAGKFCYEPAFNDML